MARIRTVKPEFWIDEDLSELCSETHLFAAALLNHCDDEGFFKANPKLLHAQIFALRELSGSVPNFIENLKNIGYLRLFNGSDGKEYGHVINFNKHQTINKPTASKIKPLELIPDSYGSDTGELPLGKERKGTWKGKEQGKELKDTLSSELDATAESIFAFWCSTMQKQKSAFSKARKKCVLDRLKEGYSVEEIQQAIVNCSNTPHNMGQNENRKVYDDLELICRSPEKLEQFRDNAGTLNQSNHNHKNEDVLRRFLGEQGPSMGMPS